MAPEGIGGYGSLEDYKIESIIEDSKAHFGLRLDMNDFCDIYPKSEIAADAQYARRMEEDFEHNIEMLPHEDQKRIRGAKLRSKALEVIVGTEAEISNWFGENAFVILTSVFDDIANGVDVVLEFNDVGSTRRIALAIDCSMRTDLQTINRKINRNLEKIGAKGAYSEVKYFESQAEQYRGKLTKVIPVVVGVDGDHFEAFLRLYSERRSLQKQENKDAGEIRLLEVLNAKVEKHPLQVVFLEEIRLQLENYRDRINEGRLEQINISEKELGSLIRVITKVVEDKKSLRDPDFENDAVFAAIASVINIGKK